MNPSPRFSLRDLPLAPRLVIAAFLICVGLGYFSALVQLHFQHAAEGQLLPGKEEAISTYHGNNRSVLERVLTAPEDRVFSGNGTMRPAFTTQSAGWRHDVRARGETVVRREREGELEVLLHWTRNGADAKAYEEDSYPLPDELRNHPITKDYLITADRAPTPSLMERVLTTMPGPTVPFSGDGSMVPALTTRSTGWKKAIKEKPEAQVRQEREGERLALLSWIRAGARKEAYEADKFTLPAALAKQPITEDFVAEDPKGKAVKIKTLIEVRCARCHDGGNTKAGRAPLATFEDVSAYCESDAPANVAATAAEPRVKLRTLIQDRCVRCHTRTEPVMDKAGRAPLETYEQLAAYAAPESSGGMPLRGLAQTTHVHLLGFSMLFALTGLVFSFTSYPLWMRAVFGPFTLVAQVIDISCWWLGRLNPLFAQVILITGGLVALGLLIQILGSLFNLFGRPHAQRA
jgi:hypothetical protein